MKSLSFKDTKQKPKQFLALGGGLGSILLYEIENVEFEESEKRENDGDKKNNDSEEGIKKVKITKLFEVCCSLLLC